ncbi:2Fe-2S iron-sulfur cluster-binding protein [Rhodovibrionaceae bacterium A322]
MTSRRLADRAQKTGREIRFSFDGKHLSGRDGDTLAAALLANGISLVGRSFKYHRPRGIYGAGLEEPNALVSLSEGAARQPNLQATTLELKDGMVVKSQNRWPSLQVDLQSLTRLAKPFLGAGFYYKTFMGPTARAWMVYEGFIRRAAGLGTPPQGPDSRAVEKQHHHCDLLIIGGGPAGLSAALEAGRKGEKVILAERDFCLGGQLLSVPADDPSRRWLKTTLTELTGLPSVKLLTGTLAFGAYDQGLFGLSRDSYGSQASPPLCLHLVKAQRAVLASGATEQSLIFANNDRPGIMLASAVRSYLNRFNVLCGQQVVIFTNNESPYELALELRAAGAQVALVDSRQTLDADWENSLTDLGITLYSGDRIVTTNGFHHITSVRLASGHHLPCDLLALSGGWQPALHLSSHQGSRPRWQPEIAAYLPGTLPDTLAVAGAARGDFELSAAISSGHSAARGLPLEPAFSGWSRALEPVRPLKSTTRGPAFVDFQNDVTAGDITQACQEGFSASEHLKRYTTLGMATDQGKSGNNAALALLAEVTGQPAAEMKPTSYRPPYAAVSLSTLAGPEVGDHFHFARRTPLHAIQEAEGAVMTPSGLWLRAWYFRENGADLEEATLNEMALVRRDAAVCDVSTLGKIDVIGPDAAELLNRVYSNGWKGLPIGKARWGLMLRDDGYVFDDGTTSRLDENRYFMTTTSAKAGQVLARLEFLLDSCWQDLKVKVTAVTDHWAALALSGPRSRDLLASVLEEGDVSDQALPFLGLTSARIAGQKVRLIRVSFSGELGYEIYVPAGQASAVWQALRQAGAGAYGLEALGALRIEKGHVAGGELDGHTTLKDLGLTAMASRKKPYVGSLLAQRPSLEGSGRLELVGLEADKTTDTLRGGAVLSSGDFSGTGEGRITSATWSPTLGKSIALALLKDGHSRHGQAITVHDPAREPGARSRFTAKVRDPHFLDPKGERMRG